MKRKVYKNGATLVYMKSKSKSTSVDVGFWFGKSADHFPEPTAHFCEHMFFQSTKNRTKEQLTKDMTETFSSNNGHTGMFLTYIDFNRSNKILEPCFELASDMLLNTNFSPKEIESEKGVIKQELIRKLSSQDTAFRVASRKTTSHYPRLKRSCVLGTDNEIDAINADILQKYHDEIFISQNFLISIEGGISYRKAKHLAEKYFISKLKSCPTAEVDKTTDPPFDRQGNLHIEKFSSRRSKIGIAFKLDDFKDVKDRVQNLACLYFLKKLSNNLNKHLLGNLRNAGLVYTANLTYLLQKTDGYLVITADTSPKNINNIVDVIGETLRDYRKNLFDKNTLEAIKKNRKYSEDESAPRPIYPSSLFCDSMLRDDYTFTRKYRKLINKAIKNTTAEDLLQYCQKIFSDPKNIYATFLTDTRNPATKDLYTYAEIKKVLTSDQKYIRITSTDNQDANYLENQLEAQPVDKHSNQPTELNNINVKNANEITNQHDEPTNKTKPQNRKTSKHIKLQPQDQNLDTKIEQDPQPDIDFTDEKTLD